MSYFDHEKLDVYQVAVELVVLLDEIALQLPRAKRARSRKPYAIIIA